MAMNMAMAMDAMKPQPKRGLTQSGFLSRRSKGEWGARIVLALVTAGLGWFSVTFSLAQVLVKSNPERAHLLAPYDGRITAAAALALSNPEASIKDRERGNNLAVRALRQDPTAVLALSTLGVNAEISGNVKDARSLFRGAQKLSRRNLQTQLWMIEDAVRRNDISGALRQYDIALRVSPNLWETLFPILASASSEAAISTELAKTLANNPPWGIFFINYAAGNSPDPQVAMRLLVDIRRAGAAVSPKAQANVIDALVKAGKFDAAWSYYAAVGYGRDRRRSRDPNFTADAETASAFDWRPIEDGGMTAVIQNKTFDFAAPASVGGSMLQQLQLLPPGKYRLVGHSVGINQPQAAQPYWTLQCRDGRYLGRVEVPNSDVRDGSYSGYFNVPADCPVQTLILIGRSSDDVSGLSGQIDRSALMPVR